MDLSAKLKWLREQAGARRGLGRALTQREVVEAMHTTLGSGISQSYLSQLEHGQRVHLSQTTRTQLALFYAVHPGYLVSDPPTGEASHNVALTPSAAELVAPGGEKRPTAESAGTESIHWSHVPFALTHPHAHHTLARLVVHPRQRHIWPIVDALIDLPDEEFHEIRRRLGAG